MPHLDTTYLSSLISHASADQIEAHVDTLLDHVFNENGAPNKDIDITALMENCFKPFVDSESDEFAPSDRLLDNLELCRDMLEHAFLTHDEQAIPGDGYCRLMSWGVHTSPFILESTLPDSFLSQFSQQLKHAGLMGKNDTVTFLNRLVPVHTLDTSLNELHALLMCGVDAIKNNQTSFQYPAPFKHQHSSAYLLVAVIHSDTLALVNEDLEGNDSAYKESLQIDMRMESHLMVSSWFKEHAPAYIGDTIIKSLLVPDYLTDSARFLHTHIISCNIAQEVANLSEAFNGDFDAEIDLQCDLKRGRLKAAYLLEDDETLHPINTEILTIRKTLFLPNELLDINEAIEQILLHAWSDEPQENNSHYHETTQAFH